MPTTISTLISYPYELARLPLVLLDRRLSQLLPETSRPKVVLDTVIGSADKLAGAVLSNADIAQRGTDRVERSEALRAADRLETEAATRRQQAASKAAAGRERAAEKRTAAQDRAASGLDRADEVEARGKQQAETEAARLAEGKKAAARTRASGRTAAVEQKTKQVTSVANARKNAQQRRPKSELAEARRTEQDAAEAKADADRLSALTRAKKQQRTQG